LGARCHSLRQQPVKSLALRAVEPIRRFLRARTSPSKRTEPCPSCNDGAVRIRNSSVGNPAMQLGFGFRMTTASLQCGDGHCWTTTPSDSGLSNREECPKSVEETLSASNVEFRGSAVSRPISNPSALHAPGSVIYGCFLCYLSIPPFRLKKNNAGLIRQMMGRLLLHISELELSGRRTSWKVVTLCTGISLGNHYYCS